MKTLKYSIILVLCVVSFGVSAQRKYFMRDHRKASFINNVDATFGLYNPSLDAINKYSSVSESGNKLNGGYMGAVDVFAHLYMDGYIGVTGGYYTDNVKGIIAAGGVTRDESLTYSAVPIGLKFVHEFHLGDPFLHRPRAAGLLLIHPYLGLGTTFWSMKQDFSRTVTGGSTTSYSVKGTYQTVNLIAGIKYTIAKPVDIGVEYNYIMGGFNQNFESAPTTQTVSVNGSYIGFKLTYLINPRLEWRYVQKVRRFR